MGCQNTPAFGGAFYYPTHTYQLLPASADGTGATARAQRRRRIYQTTLAFMFVSFRLLVESMQPAWTSARSCTPQSLAIQGIRDLRLGSNAVKTRPATISDATIQMTITPLFYSQSTDLPVLR